MKLSPFLYPTWEQAMARIFKGGQDTTKEVQKSGGAVMDDQGQVLEPPNKTEGDPMAVGEKLGMTGSYGVTDKERASIEGQGGPIAAVKSTDPSHQPPGGAAGHSHFDEAAMADKTRQQVAEETSEMSGRDKLAYYFAHLAPNVADDHVLFGSGPLHITAADLRNCLDDGEGNQGSESEAE